jgi:hypothetical protein
MWITKKGITMGFEIARFFSDHKEFIPKFRAVASKE